jgi:hypothetical protein
VVKQKGILDKYIGPKMDYERTKKVVSIFKYILTKVIVMKVTVTGACAQKILKFAMKLPAV